jgi:hypothetical protein
MLLINFSAVGHPRVGAKLHLGKEILTRIRSLRQHKTQTQVPTQTNILQYLIPHMLVPPQEVCPFSSQQSFGFPTSLMGLQNRPNRKSQSPVVTTWHLGNQFPNNSLPWRECSRPDNPLLQCPMSLTTHFFNVLWPANRLFNPVPMLSLV